MTPHTPHELHRDITAKVSGSWDLRRFGPAPFLPMCPGPVTSAAVEVGACYTSARRGTVELFPVLPT